MNIGENIRNRRVNLGMSVIELAKAVGVNRATIYRWERNESIPPKSAIYSIALILNTSVDYIYGRSSESSYLVDQSVRYFDKFDDDLAKVLGYLYENSFTVDQLEFDDKPGRFYLATDNEGISYGPTEINDIIANYRTYGLGNVQLLFEECNRVVLRTDEEELLSDYRKLNNTGKTTARNLIKGLKQNFPSDNSNS